MAFGGVTGSVGGYLFEWEWRNLARFGKSRFEV